LLTFSPRTSIHCSMPPIRTGSRLSMPLGERMARSSATLCCRYFLYNKADETPVTTKAATAIPTYLRIFLITSRNSEEICLLLHNVQICTLFLSPFSSQVLKDAGSEYKSECQRNGAARLWCGLATPSATWSIPRCSPAQTPHSEV
jgi:hypothetical protein